MISHFFFKLFCLFLHLFYILRHLSSFLYLFSVHSPFSHCLIVCRLEGIGLILITRSSTLTSPLLSLHWSLVPKPLTSYWRGPQNSASPCVCAELLLAMWLRSAELVIRTDKIISMLRVSRRAGGWTAAIFMFAEFDITRLHATLNC